MKCDQMKSTLIQLRDLHSTMVQMLPKENINQHPFDYFKEEFNSITRKIEETTNSFRSKLDKIRKCSKILKDEYKRITKELKEGERAIPEFTNVNMENEFIINELERISSKKRYLEKDIIRKSEEIYEILEELGVLVEDDSTLNDSFLNPITDRLNLNIDSLKISHSRLIFKDKFEQYEEIFNEAGLEKIYLAVREMFLEKHFYTEKLTKNKTVPNKLARSEEVAELYKQIGENINIYSYACSLLKNQEVSLEKLTKLGLVLKILQLEKHERERHRRGLFKDTSGLLVRLGIVDHEFTINQKLYKLEELNEKYSKMVKEREQEVIKLMKEIRSKEEILNLNIKNFKEGFKKTANLDLSVVNESNLSLVEEAFQINGSITTANIESLRSYLSHLTEEYNNRIREIYDNTKEYLEELCKLFTLEMGDYELTKEGIGEMRLKIESLEPKKELYMEILSLIDKREELVESMNNFEKIASDPRRLFKSSFQLLREEKFRKTAFPSLLKIEETLFKLLETYKERFGEFLRNNKSYASTLKEEIDGRIVNKTVFINKFDSPIRRKKN
ncbi:hypothetical protein NGRA_0376 [Nosema granulosis]|uniref:Uncharacterized protein n=1 Tax=Nosema granulosis TaxID=83296 RepID=A0A9P6H0Y5_9MICR|nr:hypothetical protein NGRA_0376 [Nosema granulosis]